MWLVTHTHMYYILLNIFLFPSDYVKHITRTTMNWSRIYLLFILKLFWSVKGGIENVCVKVFRIFIQICSISVLLLTYTNTYIHTGCLTTKYIRVCHREHKNEMRGKPKMMKKKYNSIFRDSQHHYLPPLKTCVVYM